MGASSYRDIDIRRRNLEVAASSTDAMIWTGAPGQRCRVLALHAIASASTPLDVNTKPVSTSGTSISGTMTPQTGVPICLPFNPHGWFESETGEGISVTTGAGQTTCVNMTIAVINDTGSLVGFTAEDGSDILLEN